MPRPGKWAEKNSSSKSDSSRANSAKETSADRASPRGETAMQPLLLGCLLALAIAGMYPRVAPDDAVEDLLAKAKAALAGGKPEEAIAFADKALRLEPTSAPASLMRGAANASLRRHKDAIADFTNAISRDP